jgi:hypothetical protein
MEVKDGMLPTSKRKLSYFGARLVFGAKTKKNITIFF